MEVDVKKITIVLLACGGVVLPQEVAAQSDPGPASPARDAGWVTAGAGPGVDRFLFSATANSGRHRFWQAALHVAPSVRYMDHGSWRKDISHSRSDAGAPSSVAGIAFHWLPALLSSWQNGVATVTSQ
jgi:hypothetical protein